MNEKSSVAIAMTRIWILNERRIRKRDRVLIRRIIWGMLSKRGVNFMSVRERWAVPFVDPKKENKLERERDVCKDKNRFKRLERRRGRPLNNRGPFPPPYCVHFSDTFVSGDFGHKNYATWLSRNEVRFEKA